MEKYMEQIKAYLMEHEQEESVLDAFITIVRICMGRMKRRYSGSLPGFIMSWRN